MRRTTTAVLVAMALVGAAAPTRAQDEGKTGVATANASEEAFLKAYFREKELKDAAGAEKLYAALAETKPASREVLARTLLGRARCLRALGRADEAAPLLARVKAEFTDVAGVVDEAAAMTDSGATKRRTLEEIIDEGLRSEGWAGSMWVWQHGVVEQGEKAVPILAKYLRGDEPEMVCRATWDLLRIDSKTSNAAVVEAVMNPSTPFPAQIARGLGVPPLVASDEVLRVAADCPHPEIRTAAIVRAYDLSAKPPDWVFPAIVGDAAASRAILVKRERTPSTALGRLLVEAVSAGKGPARDAALAAIREISFVFPSNPWLAPFLDPPPAFLKDREAMRAVWKGLDQPRGPASAALMQALFDDPETEDAALHLCFHEGDISRLKPDQVTEVLARRGFGAALEDEGDFSQDKDIEVLTKLLGSPPTPERLRRVASVFPVEGDWLKFIQSVAKSTRGGEAEFTALLDGTPNARLQKALLEWFGDAGDAVGPWVVPILARSLASPDDDVVAAALRTIELVRRRPGFDLAPHAAAIGRLLGTSRESQAGLLLCALGEPGARELRVFNAPGRPSSPHVIGCLGEMRDAESAPRIEEILLACDDEKVVRAAAFALCSIRGDDAEPKLSARISRDGGKFARAVLLGVASGSARLGEARLGDIFVYAVERAPGRIGWVVPEIQAGEQMNALVSQFPTAVLRRIALAALKSSSFLDRRWGAAHERQLLDADAWNSLMDAAKDLDQYVRNNALDALRAIRLREDELATLKAIGDERATRERVIRLLASDDVHARLAGIAAVVATRDETQIPTLITLAAEEKVEAIRAAARDALLAFGRPATPSAPK